MSCRILGHFLFGSKSGWETESRFKVSSSWLVLGWFSVTEARLRSSPDGDGVSEAREKFLHVEEARDLLQDESHVRVQIVHRAHLVVNADGRSQRVGERSDQICTVVVVWELGRDRQGRRHIRHSMKVFTKASLPPALCWRQHWSQWCWNWTSAWRQISWCDNWSHYVGNRILIMLKQKCPNPLQYWTEPNISWIKSHYIYTVLFSHSAIYYLLCGGMGKLVLSKMSTYRSSIASDPPSPSTPPPLFFLPCFFCCRYTWWGRGWSWGRLSDTSSERPSVAP